MGYIHYLAIPAPAWSLPPFPPPANRWRTAKQPR